MFKMMFFPSIDLYEVGVLIVKGLSLMASSLFVMFLIWLILFPLFADIIDKDR